MNIAGSDYDRRFVGNNMNGGGGGLKRPADDSMPSNHQRKINQYQLVCSLV